MCVLRILRMCVLYVRCRKCKKSLSSFQRMARKEAGSRRILCEWM